MSLIPNLKYTDAGIEAPTIQELELGLWDVMRKAFGDNINTQHSTPQGQLVVSLAAEFSQMQNTIIELMNLVDPRFSYGVMQEGIGAIYFLSRRQATNSVVQVEFRGKSGIVIPKGFLVSDINENDWETTESKVIESSGKVTINAKAVEPGKVEAEVGVINTIVESRSGVDSVTNNTPAVAGYDTESREDFEERREQAVAKNSKNMNASVWGEVSDLKGVLDCFVVDNPSDETITVGATNYEIIRNGLAVSVVGGDDEEIARAILTKGGTGCPFVGNTLIDYKDSENHPLYPPSYDVRFIRPRHVPVYFTVVVENFAAIGYDQEQYIKQSLLKAFRSGRIKARIGTPLVANRYLCCISNVENNVVMELHIGKSKEERVNVLNFGIDEYPVTTDLNITIEGYK